MNGMNEKHQPPPVRMRVCVCVCVCVCVLRMYPGSEEIEMEPVPVPNVGHPPHPESHRNILVRLINTFKIRFSAKRMSTKNQE
jgi:hypothetical protein